MSDKKKKDDLALGKEQLAFGKENYILFAAAFAVVIIGYLLMMGGASEDPNTFNYDEIFSTRRITIAPIIILIGIALGFYAILKKPKD